MNTKISASIEFRKPTERTWLSSVDDDRYWWDGCEMTIAIDQENPDTPIGFSFWQGSEEFCFRMQHDDLEKLLRTIQAVKSI